MRIVYGTGNPGKLQHMRTLLSELNLEIISIKDLGLPLPDIDESGNDTLENAIIKAKAFYSAIKEPVFSVDSGLYFTEVTPDLQPGVHVRRVKGKILNDSEMTAYYAGLAHQFGGKLTAQYRNSLCLAISDTEFYTYNEPDIWSQQFLIVDKPHDKREEGFPLDCLSVNLRTGDYYYDRQSHEEIFDHPGFVTFFTKMMDDKILR